MSTSNFAAKIIPDTLPIKQSFPLSLPVNECGDNPSGQFFYKNPQYNIRAIPPNALVKQSPIRLSIEGPVGSYTCTFLTKPGNNNRVLNMTNEIQVIQNPDVIHIILNFNRLSSIGHNSRVSNI